MNGQRRERRDYFGTSAEEATQRYWADVGQWQQAGWQPATQEWGNAHGQVVLTVVYVAQPPSHAQPVYTDASSAATVGRSRGNDGTRWGPGNMPAAGAPGKQQRPTGTIHQAAWAALQQNLVAGEEIRVVIRGSYDSVLIGTDRRAFVYKRGFMSGAGLGQKLATWDYAALTGVQLETGQLTGTVALQAAGIASGDLSTWAGSGDPYKAPHVIALNRSHFNEARAGVPVLRQLIMAARQPAPSAQPTHLDVADQLEKLASLRDRGILTEQEFQAKKRQLLNL